MDWAYLGGIAQASSLPLAVIALAVGAFQIISSARLSREAGALQAHRDYLQLCFENPQYSATSHFVAANPDYDLGKLLDECTDECVQYMWFLSIMINSIEQIIEFVSAKGPWREVAVDQVRYHYEAMIEVWPDWKAHYGPKLAGIVEEALERGPWVSIKSLEESAHQSLADQTRMVRPD